MKHVRILLFGLAMLLAAISNAQTTDTKDIQIAKQKLRVGTDAAKYFTSTTDTINSASTHRQLPTAKSVYNYVVGLGLGAANLTFTGSSAPYTLNSSSGTDVTINQGTGVTLSRVSNELTITNSSPDQTVSITGAGINAVTGTYPNFTVTGTEVDGSVTNEGSLTVGAGAANTSTIVSNTSGSTAVTVSGSSSVSITESGSTITAAVAADGITATEIAAGGVGTSEVADGSLTATDISTNIVSSVEGVDNDGGNIDIVGAGILAVTSDNTANTITLTATEVDGSVTNEGSLTVGAGGANTSTIVSNTSGSTAVTIEGGTNVTVTETGSTITIAASGGVPTLTNAHIFVGNASNVATDVAASGDVSLSNTGAFQVNSAKTYFGIVDFYSYADGTQQNNMAVSGSRIKLIPTAAYDITGIDASTNSGKIIYISNVGTFNVTFKNNSASSSSANRFMMGADYVLAPDKNAMIVHDGSNWRLYAGLNLEVDGSVTNEGSLTVGAGGANTSTIVSNTSGSTAVTVSGSSSVSITESGSTITAAVAADGITATEIAAGAVGTSEVADGTLTATDISTNIVSSVEGVDNDGGNIDIVGAGILAVTSDNTANTITLTATEVDGSVTNEGSLTVGAGGANTSTIVSNTSGSTAVTIEGGANVTVTESGSTITIAASSGSGTDLTITGASSPYTLNSSSGTDVTFAQGTGVTLSRVSNELTITNASPDQTVTITGAGINVATGTYPNFTVTGTEVDGSVTNEGSLTVGAGGANTSTIVSNTSGSTAVTVSGSSSVSITEAGSTITAAVAADGITATEIATGAVGTAEVADGTLTATDISTNIVSSVEGVDNDGGNIDIVGAGILAVTSDNTANTITLTATEVDGSTSNEVLTISDGTDSEALGGQTLTVSGGGIATADYVPGTNTLTISATETDGSVTNEGSLTVGAGGVNTSTIVSNTSGSTAVTIEGGANVTVTESGSTITIAASSGSGTDLTITGASSPYTLNSSSGTDVTFAQGTGVTLSRVSNELTITNASPDQTVTITGAGINVATGTYPNFTVTGTEVDGSVTNEGSLTVGAGGANTSTIVSNTSGSTAVTVSGSSSVSITEAGSTITAAVAADGITATEIATGAVGTAEVADGTLTATDISTNIVSSVEGVDNDGGNIDIVGAGILAVTSDNTANTITLTATEVDGSTTNEVLTISDGTDSEALGGQTLTVSGGGIATADYVPGTNTLTISATETDGSVTNEGSLTVGAGGANTSTIVSNTSGSTDVTVSGSSSVSITESGSTITAAVAADGITATEIATGAVGTAEVADGTLTATDIATNIVSSVEGVDNDGGNIDIVGAGILAVTSDNTANTITLTATEVDGSTTNEVLTISDGTDSEALGGQTLTVSGGGIATADYVPGTNTLTISATETDGSVTNEGSLTVGAGGANTSTIVSNTSGSTPVTIEGGTNVTVTESGSTITIAASSSTDGNGIYTGSGTIPASTTATMSGTFSIDNGALFDFKVGDVAASASGDGFLVDANGAKMGDVFGSNNYYIMSGNELGGNYIRTPASNLIQGPTNTTWDILTGNFKMTDSRATKKGVEYSADYSAGILPNARSIPDIGTIKQIYTAGTGISVTASGNNMVIANTGTADGNGYYSGNGGNGGNGTIPSLTTSTITNQMTFQRATDGAGGLVPLRVQVDAGSEPDFMSFVNGSDSLLISKGDVEFEIDANKPLNVTSTETVNLIADSITIQAVPTSFDNEATLLMVSPANTIVKAEGLDPDIIRQNGATTGQVLEWNGTKWAPATDDTGGGGVGDGDKGDIVVSGSGSVWTIDNLAVTDAKINDVAASKITSAVVVPNLSLTATNNSRVAVKYNAGAVGFQMDDLNSATAIYSEDNEQIVKTDNTEITLNSGTYKATYIDGEFRQYDSDLTNYVALKTPTTANLSANYTLTLPVDDGTANQVMATNGTGTLSWADNPTVATDPIWDAKGDLAVGTGANTAARLPVGVDAKQLYSFSSGSTGLRWGPGLISPANITIDQDDYNPANWATSQFIRVSGDASTRAITSFVKGYDGEIKTLVNTGVNAIYIPAEHPDGTAANRVAGDRDYILYGNSSATMFYDSISSRWRILTPPQSPIGRKAIFYSWSVGSITAADHGDWAFAVTGTSAAVTSQGGSASLFASAALGTGTTATGAVTAYFAKTANTPVFYGGAHLSADFQTAVATLSGGTDTYTLIYGIDGAPQTASQQNNSVGFRYSHGLNGGKWQCYVRDNAGAETTVDAGVSVVAGTPYHLRVEVDESRSEARYYLDDVFVGRIISNMPSSVACGAAAKIVKSVGLTARTMRLHEMSFQAVQN